jgi:AcrR family transcriptional regulator
VVRQGLTADRLTSAAADLADTVGFDAVTVAAVARTFGVKDASVYSHVANLQELRTRVTLLALAELADRIADAIAGRAGHEALAAFATAQRSYALEHPGRFVAMRAELEPDVAAGSAAPRHATLVRAVLRGYVVTEPEQTDAARLVLSTVHGFLAIEATGGFGHHPRDVAVSFDRAVDALDVALRNWRREPDR